MIKIIKNFFHLVFNFKLFLQFYKDKKKFESLNGKINSLNIRIFDKYDSAGKMNNAYFHQDLQVAKYIFERNPISHIDIGSRIDGFVAHVASFRKIKVLDIRPLINKSHSNINFIQHDIINDEIIMSADSVSCLHCIEHFGLGRYGDEINPDAHIKGISKLIDMTSSKGFLYLSFPIFHYNEVHFNAHRYFAPQWIMTLDKVKNELELIQFDVVNNHGELLLNQDVNNLNLDLGHKSCGIYTFQKRIG